MINEQVSSENFKKMKSSVMKFDLIINKKAVELDHEISNSGCDFSFELLISLSKAVSRVENLTRGGCTTIGQPIANFGTD